MSAQAPARTVMDHEQDERLAKFKKAVRRAQAECDEREKKFHVSARKIARLLAVFVGDSAEREILHELGLMGRIHDKMLDEWENVMTAGEEAGLDEKTRIFDAFHLLNHVAKIDGAYHALYSFIEDYFEQIDLNCKASRIMERLEQMRPKDAKYNRHGSGSRRDPDEIYA